MEVLEKKTKRKKHGESILSLTNICIKLEQYPVKNLKIGLLNSHEDVNKTELFFEGRLVDGLPFTLLKLKNSDILNCKIHDSSLFIDQIKNPRYGLRNFYHCIDTLAKTMENFAYCYDNSVLINTQLLTLNDKLTRHLYHKNTLSAILQSYTANSSLIYEKDIRNWGCFRHIITTIVNNKIQVSPLTRHFRHRKNNHSISIRNRWRITMGLESDNENKYGGPLSITIINRNANRVRKILNLRYLVAAMKEMKWNVNVIEMENLSISEQFSLIQNTSTLIGYHGAGLRWATFLHPHAAEIQVIGLPCSYESHSKMNFRKRYAIIHGDLNSMSTNHNQSYHDELCRQLIQKKYQIKKKVFDTWIENNTVSDIRALNVIVNIVDVINTIKRIDPVLNP